MQDLSELSFNMPTTLPSPDQIGGNASGPSQPSEGSAASTTTATGGATTGVDASKGALAATGVNPLVVDQNVAQTAATVSGVSGMGMDAASILGTPPIIDPQSMVTSLGKVADDIDQIGGAVNAIASDIINVTGFSPIGGRVKGDEGTKTEKGDRRDGQKKAEGRDDHKKATEGSSPSVGDSVSRSVSSTGAVTTTVSEQSINSSGGVTTSTTTTVSGGSSSSSQGSTGSTSTESVPPPTGTISMTQIMNEIGGLEADESSTMAQQQTSEIDAISLEAKDTDQQAADMDKGAEMMMTMAAVGLGVSVAGAAYQTQGIANASKAGDEAHMASLDEGNQELSNASEKSLSETELATTPKGLESTEQYVKAQSSIKQMEMSTKAQEAKGTISKDQAASYNRQAAASRNALENSKYLPGGMKEKDFKDGKWTPPTKADGTPLKNEDGTDADVSTPEKAVGFYERQAREAAATRPQGISYTHLASQGIRPGQTVSDEDAASILGTDDPAQIKALQDNVKNLSSTHTSQAWQSGYSNAAQHLQTNAAVISSLSNLFSSGLANMESQDYDAAGTRQSAAAQVQSSTIQSMQTGVSQTEDVANQLRQEQSTVASAMLEMTQDTKV